MSKNADITTKDAFEAEMRRIWSWAGNRVMYKSCEIRDAEFDDLDLRKVTFKNDVKFLNCKIRGYLLLEDATFEKSIHIGACQIEHNVYLHNTTAYQMVLSSNVAKSVYAEEFESLHRFEFGSSVGDIAAFSNSRFHRVFKIHTGNYRILHLRDCHVGRSLEPIRKLN